MTCSADILVRAFVLLPLVCHPERDGYSRIVILSEARDLLLLLRKGKASAVPQDVLTIGFSR